MKNLNMLSFDIEDWYHANYSFVDTNTYRSQNSNFRANMKRILSICAKHKVQATFFTLGSIAEDFPDVIHSIVQQGHELACHGYSHALAYQQSPDEFREDVYKAVSILENIGQTKVYGYRAPSWSIIKKNYSYLAILENLGLEYDASIFPVKTFLYGIPDAPQNIHQPVINNKVLDFYEVPMSIQNFLGTNFGYSGGFYLRTFPYFLLKYFIKNNIKKSKYSIVYLHPREIDLNERKLELPWKERLIHYYNLGTTECKLNKILEDFHFTSIKNYLEEYKISQK